MKDPHRLRGGDDPEIEDGPRRGDPRALADQILRHGRRPSGTSAQPPDADDGDKDVDRITIGRLEEQ
jgi:hypothetical protein